jgi:hypothetical protein
MRRSDLNFWVDSVAFAAFVFLVATGIIMEFLLPAGSGHATTIWGLDRHGWGGIHFWTSVVFLAALALHVYLHWKWIVSVVRGRPREGSGVRVGLGILGLVALLAIAVAPLVTPVEQGDNARRSAEPRWGLSAESELIQGSMTLEQVAEATGVTLEFLVRELGLSSDVQADDRLGRVARDNGLSVAEVREIVEWGMESADEPLTESVAEPPPSRSAPAMADQAPTHAEEPTLESSAGDHGDRPDHEDEMAGMADIRGSMTLAEIVALGVPRDILYEELGIPTGIPIDERLGRLGRTYGFSMTQVRDLVEVHR